MMMAVRAAKQVVTPLWVENCGGAPRARLGLRPERPFHHGPAVSPRARSEMSNSVRTAIVTTHRAPVSLLDAFTKYHLALGFDNIFLFADDPADPARPAAASDSRVVVVPRDAELRRRWQETHTYQHAGWARAYMEREVMARQTLNVAVAVEMARERHIDWLLHIDADELFHCRHATVAEHFSRLSHLGLASVRYLNHEAVPERPDVVDCFREVTLFKHNPRLLHRPLPEYESVLEAIPACAGGYFHFYTNGKSAARVTPDLRPDGVHQFTALPRATVTHPAILHYACCTFEIFWAKYRALGNFGDKWFGATDIRDAIGSTHLDSRDAVGHGDRNLAAAFYQSRFVAREQDAALLIDHGLAARVHEPSAIIAAIV